MIQILARTALLAVLLSSAVQAQEPAPEGGSPASQAVEQSPAEIAAQNQAIAQSVQQQLLACWRLPAGYEGRTISVRLAFFGDGTLEGEPVILPESQRIAGKYPALMQSIVRAVGACLPFEGLEALGAGPDERFDISVHFQS